MIFWPMVAKDVDLDYPTRDMLPTDTAISSRHNGTSKLEERELEPWDSGINGSDMPLELDAANGWDADDMFRKNEQEYGVQSTDTADYKEAEAKANIIASEIESQPAHKARSELENGDEEAAFASVVRPHQESNTSTNGKYIPPAKRKNQNNGKLVRSTPPPSQSSSNQNTPSPKETRPPMSYPTHASHQNNVHVPPEPWCRPHSHTPPQQYQQPPIQNPQQYQQEMKPQEVVNIPNVPSRHRDETVKELQAFAQDFKLAPMQNEPPQMQGPPPVVEQVQQVQPIPPPPSKPPQASPPQPQQSISPQQDNIEKVTNTLKKSTLNPNAKEFVLNPAAKPFQPRSPSTPSASRPHTPQTPSHSPYIPSSVGGPGVQPQMPVMMPVYHVMTSQPQYQAPQGNRIKRIPMSQMRTDMASQMQVAAATGQPPASSSSPTAIHIPTDHEPSLPTHAHGGKNPTQYNPAQGPQAPTAAVPGGSSSQGHHQFPLMYPIIPAQPHMMQSMQYLQQAPPPPQHQMPVLMHQHHGQGNPHGPNP
ncbi:hypothetical protein NQ317_013371 [Molorchus minor]|uniref:LsmAD domain-containing protein n=1 Tax=Molorchus minor TaxID=1323400 RepID=A0ABQ9J1S2_9CUCU|nr:hypothetical protein NQ317_013371 [Molorchus minor]